MWRGSRSFSPAHSVGGAEKSKTPCATNTGTVMRGNSVVYGALIVDPPPPAAAVARDYVVQIGEWRVVDGKTYPAMDLDGVLPNFFTLNGKAYPATERLQATVGERVRIRLVGSGQFLHPMHLHGQPFEIVATDGNAVPPGARLTRDTVLVRPGERSDVEFLARAGSLAAALPHQPPHHQRRRRGGRRRRPDDDPRGGAPGLTGSAGLIVAELRAVPEADDEAPLAGLVT